MTDSENTDKLEKRDTIIRVVHNRENPFVQLNKQALWDTKLSLKATGLWARCLSRPDNWKFSMKELVKNCQEGRCAVDSAMQELMTAGYALRMEAYIRGSLGKFQNKIIEYVFFEFPATKEECDDQLEIFKKSFRDCGFRNFGHLDFGHQHLLIKSNTNIDSMHKDSKPPFPPAQKPESNAALDKNPKQEPTGSKPAEAGQQEREKKPTKITPEIKELAKSMNASLEEANPDYRTPSNQTAFLKEVELMVRLDQREPEKVLEVLEWALEDTTQRGDFNGWSSVMYSKNPAASLRKHFAKIAQQMTSKPKKQERKFLPCSDDDEALRIMKEMSARAI